MSARRVGVIGGGLAGIASALTLADAGMDVTLIERRSRLGGLTSSIERDGLSFDNGQHVFLRCCTSYRSFIERIGAREQVYLQPRLNVPVISPTGVRTSIRRTRLPAPFHLAASIARYQLLTYRERLALLRPLLALRRLDVSDPTLDTVSFGDWLRARGQSMHSIERLWNLIIQPTLNVSAQNASLALAAQVFQVGFLERADGADMGWSTVPLAQLHGENSERALRASGVTVLLNASATQIVSVTDRTFQVQLADGVESLPFDAVVVATPPRVAASLGVLDPKLDVPEGLGTSPIVNIHFILDRRVTELPMAACVDSPIEFFFDRTDASSLASGQCLAISLSAADAYIGVGSSELVPTFHAALCELFPLARDATVLNAVVTREHAATFKGSPGVAAFRPSSTTMTEGLFLAGAWCNTGWPATMEGAVRSGNEAARGVLSLFSGFGSAGPVDRERVKT